MRGRGIPKEGAGSPAWWLVAITTALVASFFASTFYAQWAAHAIDDKAQTIATTVSPSISALSSMRADAYRMTVAVRGATGQGAGSEAVASARRHLEEAFARLAPRVGDPEERVLLSRLDGQRQRMASMIDRLLEDTTGGTSSDRAVLAALDLEPAISDLDGTIHRLLELNSRQANVLAIDIKRLRARSERMAYGLNGLTALLGLTAMMLAARASRHQLRLLREKERQVRLTLERSRLEEERTRLLQEVTAALSEALTLDEVGKVVTERAIPALGGSAGALLRTSDDGRKLVLVASIGGAGGLESLRELPLENSLVPADDACSGEPLFMESGEPLAARHPELAEDLSTVCRGGLVVLPLVSQGNVLGVVVVCFSERREPDGDQRRLMSTMSKLCAQALERARLYGEAERASRAKDEFLALLGHELRNPLAPMTTALQLMKLRGEPGDHRERAVIERQLQHLTRLVDDLLDVSRITRAKIELKRRPVEISVVVARALEVAAPLLEQRRHRLSLSVPATGLMVNGDEPRLTQVVSNLLTNAAKYTPPGGSIAVAARREGELVSLQVKDNGLGIDPDLLPRIFGLFVQGPRSIARSEGGLGLGLALVHSLVSLHGGAVRAESPGPGRGSTFTVTLPLAENTRVPLGQGEAWPEPENATGRKILVVDDNADAADALAETLRELGYTVNVAYDGPRALDLVGHAPVDIALLDIGLPVMDGYELAQRLRVICPDTKLIAVTGYGQEHDRQRALVAGFEHHFVKPVDLGQLVQGIESALR